MTQDEHKQPETEVRPKAKRRTFSASYKHRILAEADQCQRGERGALLRREGLYHSHLSTWRAEREAGTLVGKKHGPVAHPDRAEAQRLRMENERLKRKLADAEAIIDAQKKLAALMDRLTSDDAT